MAREYSATKRANDEVTSELLATGCATYAQIAKLFETDAKTLPQRLKMVPPAGTRHAHKVYRIRDVAAFLVTPGYEIEEYIRQMSPQELPPLLSKEFWNGQKSRLDFEIKEGQHWPTEDVVEYVAELMNVLRMTLLLVVDDVNREDTLTDGQRAVFQRITDGAIATLRENVAKRFETYHADRADDRDEGAGDLDPISAADDDDDDPILAAEEDEEEDDGI